MHALETRIGNIRKWFSKLIYMLTLDTLICDFIGKYHILISISDHDNLAFLDTIFIFKLVMRYLLDRCGVYAPGWPAAFLM